MQNSINITYIVDELLDKNQTNPKRIGQNPYKVYAYGDREIYI